MNVREKKLTLEDLLIQKQELKKQIESQQQKLVESYLLIEPFSFNPMHSSLMKKLTTGFAIFDGFMIGLKVIRKIKNLFR